MRRTNGKRLHEALRNGAISLALVAAAAAQPARALAVDLLERLNVGDGYAQDDRWVGVTCRQNVCLSWDGTDEWGRLVKTCAQWGSDCGASASRVALLTAERGLDDDIAHPHPEAGYYGCGRKAAPGSNPPIPFSPCPPGLRPGNIPPGETGFADCPDLPCKADQ